MKKRIPDTIMSSMMEKKRGLILKFTACLCLALHPSCSEGPADKTADRYRQIVDITRDEAALQEYLKPIPPTEPADALKTFETAGGFHMELVAHEPLVTEPVAATFDEDGRMYVAEIVGYPYQPGPGEEPLGRIRLLEDRDGDGRFDVGHIFADRLVWPTGVAPWKGGVFGQVEIRRAQP